MNGGRRGTATRAVGAVTGAAVAAVALLAGGCAHRRDVPRVGRQAPTAVVLDKFAAVNRHDVDAVVAHYAPDAVLTAADFCGPRRGQADVARTYRTIFAAVPDASVEVRETVAQGDRVAVRFVLRGTVAGRAFELPIMNFFTVRDGLIVRDDGGFDNRGRPCTP